ncbi:MAG TPA: class I SAM-dependent methyltransferase [Burkholderiaceae bacterium]|nr:class I SAM-dependent methyltransferase [Burkholderiaceae bacterium]
MPTILPRRVSLRDAWERLRQRPLRDWPAFAAAKFRWIVGGALARRFDRRHRVDTGGVLRRDQMTAISERGAAGGADYVATSPWTFRSALSRIPERDFSEFAFIDFGCGKGRPMLLAAAGWNFDRVIGVEHSPELAAIAARNVRDWRGRRSARQVEALCADALTFPMPALPYVLYLFGPFGGNLQLVRQMLDHLTADLHARPRRAYIVYVDGVTEQLPDAVMRSAGFVALTRPGGERRRFDPGILTVKTHFAVYRHDPNHGADEHPPK